MSKLRTIKFRGFNKKRGVWLYGNYILNRGAHFIAPQEFADGKTWDDYEVEEESIGQFIGLYDRNGKEIYEGEILKCYDDETDPLSCDYLCVVRYNTTIESITPGFILCGENIDFPITEFEAVEAIGAVFDNPELLEKGGKK